MKPSKNKVVHLTSAHGRYDTRIFLKMCSSLAAYGYDMSLVVADGEGDEVKNGVMIFDVGAKPHGRLSRMTKTVNDVLEKAIRLDGDIYHLHDPELMPVGIKLKKLGKKVIFDAHEDLPRQLLGKPYLNWPTKIVLSITFALYERYACRKFDYIVSATSHIRDKFLKINKNCMDINNFPILGELSSDRPWDEKRNEVCYVGGISQIRGIQQVVKALEITTTVKLNLVGIFGEKAIEKETKAFAGWEKVNELGFLDRQQVSNIMGYSKAGIVTFLPSPNHVDAQPNKMFEYMSAGLPIITSNFPLWAEMIKESGCGICVDPLNPEEIARAIEYISSHPKEADNMGQNGKKAVLEKYNWSVEEVKLFNVYDRLVEC